MKTMNVTHYEVWACLDSSCCHWVAVDTLKEAWDLYKSFKADYVHGEVSINRVHSIIVKKYFRTKVVDRKTRMIISCLA